MKTVGKILFLMYLTTAVLLFLLAFLVQKFGWQEKGITAGVCIVSVLSCFLGGFFAGRVQKTRKFLWGILMGVLYIAGMSVMTFLVKKGFSGGFAEFFWNVLFCVLGGMFGGMIS